MLNLNRMIFLLLALMSISYTLLISSVSSGRCLLEGRQGDNPGGGVGVQGDRRGGRRREPR